MPKPHATPRRQVLAGARALATATSRCRCGQRAQLAANPAALAIAIRKVAGEADVKPGKVKLEIPPLSENGNSVSVNVTVDSPMTAANHVKAIHIFTEKNPQPNVISTRLGPRAGKAAIATRMRLADTQTCHGGRRIERFGTFWLDKADVVVTLGAPASRIRPDGPRADQRSVQGQARRDHH